MDAPQGSSSTEPTYIAESLGGHGEDYQRQLGFILIQRLVLEGYMQFQMGFEMAEAGKFDDLGLILNISWHLIQCKHNQKGENISYEDLFNVESRDFALVKYLIAYHNMKFKYGPVDKMYLFTNRNLNPTFNKESYEIIDLNGTEVGKLFKFSKGIHLKLKNQEEALSNALYDYEFKSAVNQISDKLKDLFINKKMDKILIDHHHYLKQLLKEDGIHVSIKAYTELTSPMIKDLYKKLKEKIGEDKFNNIKVEKNVMKGFWTCNDEKKKTVYHDTIKIFLDKLVLSVSQPNVEELKKEMIDEGRLWMRSWMYPDDLGRMGSNFYEIPWNIIKNAFNKYEKLGEPTGSKGQRNRVFLSYEKGKKIMQEMKTNLSAEIQKFSKRSCESLAAMNSYYIPRHMIESESKILDLDFVQNLYSTLENGEKLYGTYEKEKCFVLTAPPGTGKSSICQYMASESQKCYKDKTVFLLYCNNFQKEMNEVKKLEDNSKKSKNESVGENKKSLDESSKENIKLEDISKIFANVLSNENIDFVINETNTHIIIFLDAFDEMSDQNQKYVLQLLKILLLKENIKIIITGRRHVEQSLRNSLNAVFMELEAFTQDEQKEFLKKIWVNSKTNETKFEKFADKILGKLKSDISRHEHELTGIPLIMRMLAQIYERPFEKYLGSDSDLNQFISEEKMSLIGLLGQFATRCTEITMNKDYNVNSNREISGIFKPLIEIIDYTYQVLAVNQILIKPFLFSRCESDLMLFIANKKFYDTLKSFQENIEKQHYVLVEIIAGEARLFHLVFAEYFTAKHLFEFIGQKEAHCCVPEIIKCLNEYKNIKYFLFLIIESNIILNSNDIQECFQILDQPNKNRLQLLKKLDDLAIMWACEGDFSNILKYLHHLHDPFWFENFQSKTGKTFLQIAADHNAQKVEAFLIETIKQSNAAVKSDRIELSNQLIAEQKDINLLDEDGMLNNLAGNGAQLDIIDKNDNNLLHSACSNGNLEIVKHLASQYDQLLNAENKAGETPLDIALKKLHMDVAEHLIQKYKAKTTFYKYKMSDYILEYVDSDGLENIEQFGILSACFFSFKKLFYRHKNARYMDMEKIIEICLLLQMDAKSTNKNGETGLHYAVTNDCIEPIKKILCKNNEILNIQKKDGKTALHIAIERNSNEVVKFLISHYDVDLSLVDCMGNSILHRAVRYSDEEIFKFIIEKFVSSSISLDTAVKNGESALSIAINIHRFEKAQLLVENGADLSKVNIEYHDFFSFTFFQFILEKREELALNYGSFMRSAAKNGYDTFIKTLADCGADVNVLDIAVRKNHVNVVKELINCGAEVNHLYARGKTALHFCESKEMYEFLVRKGAKEDEKDENGNIGLHIAVINEYTQLVKYILERDQNLVNYRNKQGQTALHTVAKSNFDRKSDLVEIAEFLIRKGANMNSKDDEGKTPIVYAVEEGNLKLVQFLKKQSAEINLNEFKGMLPKSYGDQFVTQSLLEVGVNVNEVDEEGRTALHNAARMEYSRTIPTLLKAGASADILDKTGKKPFYYALERYSIDSEDFALLLSYTSNIDHINEARETPLQQAMQYSKDWLSRLLIAKGASIDWTTFDGDSALHLAIKHRRLDLAVLFVDRLHRFEMDRKNSEGHTPLYLAVSEDQISLVKKIVHKGVSESNFDAAIQLAQELVNRKSSKSELSKEILEFLQKWKSGTPNWTEYTSPLHLAVLNDNIDRVENIVNLGKVSEHDLDTAIKLAQAKEHKEISRFLQQFKSKSN